MKTRSPTMARSRSRGTDANRRAMTPSRERTTRSTANRKGRTGSTTARRGTSSRRRAGPRLSPGRRTGKMTTDHEAIRRWVEARGGHPATVTRTARGRQAAGVIRIDFPGFSGAKTLKPISWDEWFNVFDERQLAFIYQDKTSNGKQSRFNKLVARKAGRK